MPTYMKLNVRNLQSKIKPPNREVSEIKHQMYVLKYDSKLMDCAYRLLTKNGYAVEKVTEENYESNCYVDDQLCVNWDKNTLYSRFSNHCDNKAVLDHDVHTCIFYLENTFKSGGDLRIMSSVRVDATCLESIDTKKYNVVLLDGSVPHEIGAMQGKGQRRCIVVQIRQIKNES